MIEERALTPAPKRLAVDRGPRGRELLPPFWDEARRSLDGLPGGLGLNIAHEAVDRHAQGPSGDVVALRCLSRSGTVRNLTYAELSEATNRFANALVGLGVGAGDRVFVLLPRRAELYIAVLGALKAKAVVSPLFPAFGPEPIRQRMVLGDARVLVTTDGLYRRRIAPIRAALPANLEVILVADLAAVTAVDGTVDAATLLASASPAFTIPPTSPDDMALLHFTSGTTGTPKGAVHVHGAVIAHYATGQLALDLRPGDVFWCTADPGWVTGTSYGIISPLCHGVTVLVDEGDFDADRWYATLAEEHVTVWYTAPTAIRMLMRAGDDLPQRFDLGALRFIASVGEALSPDAVLWGERVLGRPIHDNWWQTETGGIMIGNTAAITIRPGSMGHPLPGVDAAVLRADGSGNLVLSDGEPIVAADGEQGHLALRAGWPSMFRGYLHDPDRYASCFVGGWYLSGDLARRDADGYFWFVARADDVIKSSGHLIGPFEVESVINGHPAVIESGVIGTPDPVAGEVVKAFVSLRAGYVPSDDLALDIIGFARTRLGAAVAPRQIAFTDALPKTKSGKIMRRLLRARELGLAEGDTSTLEHQS